MTRGNPRPGQQQMPDRSDEVEQLAHKLKAATTRASGEILDGGAELPEEARQAARKASRKLARASRRAGKAPE